MTQRHHCSLISSLHDLQGRLRLLSRHGRCIHSPIFRGCQNKLGDHVEWMQNLWLLTRVQRQRWQEHRSRRPGYAHVEFVDLREIQQFAFHLSSTWHEEERQQVCLVLHKNLDLRRQTWAIEQKVISNAGRFLLDVLDVPLLSTSLAMNVLHSWLSWSVSLREPC